MAARAEGVGQVGTGLFPLLEAHRIRAELELRAREMLLGEGPRVLIVLNLAGEIAQVHPHRGRRRHLKLVAHRPEVGGGRAS